MLTPKDDLNIEEYFPSNKHNFYLYNGSFTTPGCDEMVTWIVLKEPNKITERQVIFHFFNCCFKNKLTTLFCIIQLEELRMLKGVESNNQVTQNIRHLQPLNGRVVMQTSGQALTKASWILNVIFFIITAVNSHWLI